ncbi:hypothetical protein [Virgibacillus doumboii]|uniref:hypothetical protein n=1 Tax=Virgibacillus doumboii TaxID=2697503 RepID=UPI0013DFA3FB|nr:hypothetical protein [Virgibacillus doumboii]
MKKGILVGIIVLFICVSWSFWFYGRAGAELTTNKSGQIHKEDFTLNIRVEKIDDGFRVLRSIQYNGEGEIEIEHQTPLISVSFKHKNHDYTGSTVTKVLKAGNSYHPQDPVTFESPSGGEYTLYSESRFNVKGKEITINHEENLIFE